MDSSASTPLADYFWIAGVESISYQDPLQTLQPQQVEETIDEHGELESVEASRNSAASRTSHRHSRQSSGNRLSKLSLEKRFSAHTLEDIDDNTRSNRSSTTIKAPLQPTTSVSSAATPTQDSSSNGGAASGAGSRNEFDFDQILVKFAVERENFLEDLSFSAGAKLHARPPMISPRAEKIRADETEPSGRRSPLRGIKGSIRRKLSFRDMNSVRKPHNTAQAASVRASKRLSNYNSVIPPPEPLNSDPDMHPLKRRFEPVLLDRYPPRSATEEILRRGKFPDYVPMFAFPNDIQIVSSDDRPRSTWHGFTMTSDDNSKVYGIAITIWTVLKADTADEVEKRCEQWRQSHMSDEERELAASLGKRLAAERANLSQLLAKLPGVPSGSPAREVLDDQISTVEEKISLMAEMLRPLRHGAASKIDGLTSGETGLWVPRAYGILGRDSTRMAFWKEWLRAVIVPMTDGAVLRIPPSSPKVGRWQPLERYVVNLCTEAFSPLSSKTQVELGVRELPSLSPISTNFPTIPTTPISRNDSGFAVTQTLREKRSGHFDEKSRRSSSFGVADRNHPLHRPSLQYLNGHSHTQSMSISAVSVDSQSSYGGYAPSTYAQSTLAASTVMPNMIVQPHLVRPTKEQKANGQVFAFDINGFVKSLPYDQQEYVSMLRNTQGKR
ncbi:hypothetical protein SCUCBS95973_003578 [Sporothrix curviconia]|uniref:uDENN domain-containing protein n=1 Tax=Sporothrix curviconia TaxID=1260050 RepID=A0ABP0BGF5_9PEZI